MSPRPPSINPHNSMLTDSKHLSYISLKDALLQKVFNLADFVRSKFSIKVFFTKTTSSPATILFNHVLGIVFISPSKEMVRVHTRWPITAMADNHSIRNFSKMKFIAKTVSSYSFGMSNSKVPVRRTTFLPKPAIVIVPFNESSKISFFRAFLRQVFSPSISVKAPIVQVAKLQSLKFPLASFYFTNFHKNWLRPNYNMYLTNL